MNILLVFLQDGEVFCRLAGSYAFFYFYGIYFTLFGVDQVDFLLVNIPIVEKKAFRIEIICVGIFYNFTDSICLRFVVRKKFVSIL